MDWQKILTNALWMGPLPFLLAIAVVMRRRGLVKDFPAFFALIIVDLLSFSVEWFVAHRPGATYPEYFYSYWSMATLKMLLGVLVLYEVFGNVFREYEGLRRFSSLLFQWGAVVLLTLAVLTAALAPAQGSGSLVRPVLMLERSLRLVQVGLVLLLFAGVRYLRMRWPRHAFGVALGAGVYAAITLAASAVMAALGYDDASQMFTYVKPGAHVCAVLLWAAYLVPADAPVTVTTTVPSHSLQRWNEALLHFLNR